MNDPLSDAAHSLPVNGSLDFVSDAFTDGRRFRVLTVVDDFSRECLALVTDTSLSGLRMTRELDTIIKRCGNPVTIVSDNGTEMTSMAVLKWCQETGVVWHYIAPGNPSQRRFACLPGTGCRTGSSRASMAASGMNA